MSNTSKQKIIVMQPSTYTKEDEPKIKSILEHIENDPISFEFLKPVDTIRLGLMDYFDIVKHPMDVSTIKKNIKNGKYSHTQDIIDDIHLIWLNCKMYNMEGSEIYKMAEHMERTSKKVIEKYYKANKVPAFNSKFKY